MKTAAALPRDRTARPAPQPRREWWGAHSAHARLWALRKLHCAYDRFMNVNRRPDTNIVKCLPDGQCLCRPNAVPRGTEHPESHWVTSGHLQCKGTCPLNTLKQTCAVQLRMSALGQKRTSQHYSATSAPQVSGKPHNGRGQCSRTDCSFAISPSPPFARAS